MKRIVSLLLLIALAVCLCSCSRASVNTDNTEQAPVILVAGLDDAAGNTDVLFTVSIDEDNSSVNVAQIPRDSFFGFGSSQNKINQIYSAYRSEGHDEYSSMSRLTALISETFGAPIMGYIALGTSAFGRIVDALGGVDIVLSKELIIDAEDGEQIYLKAGENHINGATAERFVRYRRGYATADLGRMDAQKIFLNAIFKKAMSSMTLPSIISLAGVVSKYGFTDLSLGEIMPLMLSKIRGGNKQIQFVTMPGEAALSAEGLSYYIINRSGAMKIAAKYMKANREFDPKLRLLNKDNEEFTDIYYDTAIYYKEYTADDIISLI